MKNVLIFVADLNENGGVTSVIMNYYDRLKKEYNIDFCAMYDKKSVSREYVEMKGSNYYVYPQKNNRPDEEKTMKFIKNILSQKKYDIVHVNITGKYAVLALKLSKRMKIQKRIYHAHNPKEILSFRTFVRWIKYEPICIKCANVYFACSNYAGKSVFGRKEYFLIRNTFDVKEFKYDIKKRDKIRNKLNIDKNTFVLGTVARMAAQKNPFFIIEIFNEVLKFRKDSVLVWVGDGNLNYELEKLAKKEKIYNKIRFIGRQNNVNQIYSAFDSFVLPSKYEGLGIVFLEAQASGLPVYASTKVPRDTKLTSLIEYLSINKSARYWANKIISNQNKFNREDFNEILYLSDYERTRNNDMLIAYNKILGGTK